VWARVEAAARRTDAHHLAVQAAAERALTMTWTGALSVAGVLCDRLLAELEELERTPGRLTPPPIDAAELEPWAGVWFSVAGLHRLRAEQLRRAGDYAGAFEELDEADRHDDQRPRSALPLWGRVILSDSLRLAGDFEGALEVAEAASRQAAGGAGHPWVTLLARRSVACARLAAGALDAALAGFHAMADDPAHRHAEARIACDLGIGEALRRRDDHAAAEHHVRRASDEALRLGHVVAWIQAQLRLAELARARDAHPAEIAAIVSDVRHRLPLGEHPWLALRTLVVGALSAPPAQAERLIDRAEAQLPRFQRRSGDLMLEEELVERCRVAVETGRPGPPLALDFL
jgi:tetratricopeptide (TPR) repeat protein